MVLQPAVVWLAGDDKEGWVDAEEVFKGAEEEAGACVAGGADDADGADGAGPGRAGGAGGDAAGGVGACGAG